MPGIHREQTVTFKGHSNIHWEKSPGVYFHKCQASIEKNLCSSSTPLEFLVLFLPPGIFGPLSSPLEFLVLLYPPEFLGPLPPPVTFVPLTSPGIFLEIGQCAEQRKETRIRVKNKPDKETHVKRKGLKARENKGKPMAKPKARGNKRKERQPTNKHTNKERKKERNKQTITQSPIMPLGSQSNI